MKHDDLGIDYCDEYNMYELVKYDAVGEFWKCLHIYSPKRENLEELIKIIDGEEDNANHN